MKVAYYFYLKRGQVVKDAQVNRAQGVVGQLDVLKFGCKPENYFEL
jgi:hypothetical protein